MSDVKQMIENARKGVCPENTGCGTMQSCVCDSVEVLADALERAEAVVDAARPFADHWGDVTETSAVTELRSALAAYDRGSDE